MATKISTIPPKRLSETITAAATSFKLNDILGFDGVALSSSIVGDTLYASFQDTTGTILELMKIDPTTIASTSITILKRGLSFNEDGTETEVPANKLQWIKNQCIVNLGTDVPQMYNLFVKTAGDQTIAGTKTFSSSPQVPTPDSANDAVNKDYADTKVSLTGDEDVDGIKTFLELPKVPLLPIDDDDVASKKFVNDTAAYGAPLADEDTAGIVEEATQAEFDAGTSTGATGARLFTPPSVLTDVQQLQLKTLTAGEALAVGDALMIADGTEARLINEQATTATVQERIVDAIWAYQSFTTGSTTTSIKRVQFKYNLTVSGLTVRLRATPTGADIAVGTSDIPNYHDDGGIAGVTFPANTVSPNTVYYLVISIGSSNPAMTNNLYGSATSVYSRGQSGRSTDSGATWGVPPTVAGDFWFKVYEVNTIAGRVYKTRTDADNITGTSWYNNFIGFSKAITSMGSLATIQPGNVAKMLSSLTPASTYYLSDTPGAISSSAGTVSKKIGLALSATELLIKHDN